MTEQQQQKKRKRTTLSHIPDKRLRLNGPGQPRRFRGREIPHQQRHPRNGEAAGQQLRRAPEEAQRLRKGLVYGSVAASGRVLLLQFAYLDSDRLYKQAQNVQAAFQNKGFEVSGDENTVLIIYYKEHGGTNAEGELRLSSTDKRQRPHQWASVTWPDIRKHVLVAKRNVGIFLECCHAGVAARERAPPLGGDVTTTVEGLEHDILSPRRRYQKEVIAATSWGGLSWGKMGKALCSVLNAWNQGEKGDGSLSMETLYERMVDYLALEKKRAPQPVRWRLHGSESGKVRLPYIRR
ncbi:hypothetical protein F5Y06DRAFT_307688 [Hypoxylon sp. FL0890]|nr:hypothetical protein F5Y06DRAFT_307688 [Hypoxylon sp. FL0890]